MNNNDYNDKVNKLLELNMKGLINDEKLAESLNALESVMSKKQPVSEEKTLEEVAKGFDAKAWRARSELRKQEEDKRKMLEEIDSEQEKSIDEIKAKYKYVAEAVNKHGDRIGTIDFICNLPEEEVESIYLRIVELDEKGKPKKYKSSVNTKPLSEEELRIFNEKFNKKLSLIKGRENDEMAEIDEKKDVELKAEETEENQVEKSLTDEEIFDNSFADIPEKVENPNDVVNETGEYKAEQQTEPEHKEEKKKHGVGETMKAGAEEVKDDVSKMINSAKNNINFEEKKAVKLIKYVANWCKNNPKALIGSIAAIGVIGLLLGPGMGLVAGGINALGIYTGYKSTMGKGR